jgi:hypothetical protein
MPYGLSVSTEFSKIKSQTIKCPLSYAVDYIIDATRNKSLLSKEMEYKSSEYDEDKQEFTIIMEHKEKATGGK